VTDTDLFTAGENTDSNPLSTAVTTDAPDVKPNASSGSLSTMVLAELRALANQVGVKGTSGMRKNELIAAIKEIRGQANGTSAPAAPEDSGKSDQSDTATADAPAEAPAAHGEQNGSTGEPPRRERRGAAREAGSPEADKRQDRQQDTKTDERGGDQQG
jgi:transcription termination factor Rho